MHHLRIAGWYMRLLDEMPVRLVVYEGREMPQSGASHPEAIMTETLLLLAERCEQASAPSEALFEEAFWACNPSYADIRALREYLDAKAWFDAAMSFVQPNWWFSCSGPMSPAAYGYSREDQRTPRAGMECIGEPYSSGAAAAVLPLAILAMALKARARANTRGEGADG
jgi:hypothetical protein